MQARRSSRGLRMGEEPPQEGQPHHPALALRQASHHAMAESGRQGLRTPASTASQRFAHVD
eukprot:2341082-Pyramimonas_sp.AAC.1